MTDSFFPWPLQVASVSEALLRHRLTPQRARKRELQIMAMANGLLIILSVNRAVWAQDAVPARSPDLQEQKLVREIRNLDDAHAKFSEDRTQEVPPWLNVLFGFLGGTATTAFSVWGARRARRGEDRMLKVNTAKARQHSLYNQGSFWYDALPNMPHDRVATLMAAYDATIREHEFFREIFGVI